MHRQDILTFDIHNYSMELVHDLRPYMDEYCIRERDLEYVFDWCIAYSINRLLFLDIQGYVFNIPINDIYRDIYYSLHSVIDSMVLNIFDKYRNVFNYRETVKLMVTFNTIIIVRSF